MSYETMRKEYDHRGIEINDLRAKLTTALAAQVEAEKEIDLLNIDVGMHLNLAAYRDSQIETLRSNLATALADKAKAEVMVEDATGLINSELMLQIENMEKELATTKSSISKAEGLLTEIQNMEELDPTSIGVEHAYGYARALTEVKIIASRYWKPDTCSVCKGTRGGIRGNENIVDGVLICDYCDAKRMDEEKKKYVKVKYVIDN
jgi:hypothetical protein